MSIIDARKLNPTNNFNADVCIIGAGMAGILAGTKIARCRKDLKVIILESGGTSFDQKIHDLNEIDLGDTIKYNHKDNRYRGIGGSSSHWGGRLLPLKKHDIEARPYLNLEAWPLTYEELNKYNDEIESLLKVDSESYEEDLLSILGNSHHHCLKNDNFNIRFPKWLTF